MFSPQNSSSEALRFDVELFRGELEIGIEVARVGAAGDSTISAVAISGANGIFKVVCTENLIPLRRRANRVS